jgi:hypothetical protein
VGCDQRYGLLQFLYVAVAALLRAAGLDVAPLLLDDGLPFEPAPAA